MGKYVVRRLLMMIPTFLGATFLIFVMAYAMPGDPTAGRCGQRPCPPNYVAWFYAHYGLDKPFLVQYGLYLKRLFTGDLGLSFYANSTVVHQLAIRYPTTVKLAVIAIICEIIIGVSAGVLAGIRHGRFIDSLVTVSTLIVIAIPVFVLGGLAQMVFGIKLRWFPVTSDGSWFSLILPGIVLGSLYVAYVARLTRTNLVENLRADYVRTAYAKGMMPRRAIGLHAMRNSLIPSITYIGASFGGLMSGAIITERIFNINGVGSLIFRSINQRDGQTLVGSVLVIVLIYMVMTLVVDVLYGYLDPRIGHE